MIYQSMEPVKTERIFLVTIAANIIAMTVGLAAGWMSPTIPKLKAQNSTESPLSRPITTLEESFINSVAALGAVVSPFAAGYLADRFGRKAVLLYSSSLNIVSYILMLIANDAWIIIIGRLFTGFGVGFVTTVQPIYVGEIATDKVRGAAGSIFQVFVVLGILYGYAIGPYVSYFALQYYCLAVPIIFVAVFVFMPESPYYYVQKTELDKALKSLQFLRGQNIEVVKEEVKKIHDYIEGERSADKGNVADIFRVRGNRKAFFIALGLMTFQQLSGINVLTLYTQSVFENAHIYLDPAVATIVIGIVQLISSFSTPFFADRIDRKLLLMSSTLVMSLSLISLGSYFFVNSNAEKSSKMSWLPLPALALHNIAYFSGFGPILLAILGEMFATNIKSSASSIVWSFNWILGSAVGFAYPILNVYGEFYTIWLFGVSCIIAFFFIFSFVVETRGLSFQQIQYSLNK